MPLIRDEALEKRLLEAVIADRNSTDRSRQKLLGPSQIGQCRELLRGGLFDAENPGLMPEEHWAAAAHLGGVFGDDLERIFGQRLGAITQQRITTLFESLGVSISGAMDLVFLDDDQVSDIKTVDDMGSLLSDLEADSVKIQELLDIKERGGLYVEREIVLNRRGEELYGQSGEPVTRNATEYRVKWMNRLSNYVQLSIYLMGAMQSGVIDPDRATGRLIFVDRSGGYLGFVCSVFTREMVDLFFAIAQHRLRQVVDAQEMLDRDGDPRAIHYLRDKSPSWCYSPRVMCIRRELCWGGSDLAPLDSIDDPEHVRAIELYIKGRDTEKLGAGMKRSAKNVLAGDGMGQGRIAGRTADGLMVAWDARDYINVVDTGVKEEKNG